MKSNHLRNTCNNEKLQAINLFAMKLLNLSLSFQKRYNLHINIYLIVLNHLLLQIGKIWTFRNFLASWQPKLDFIAESCWFHTKKIFKGIHCGLRKVLKRFEKQLRCKRSSRSNFILKAERFLEAIALYDRRHVPSSKVRFHLFLMFSVNA